MSEQDTLVTDIVFFGQSCRVVCDRNCGKAWGINSRPREQLSDNPDDYAFLADDALGAAPDDPGTYEGGHAKPSRPERHNKWCARECERSVIVKVGEAPVLPDFSRRRLNLPHMDAEGLSRAWDIIPTDAGDFGWAPGGYEGRPCMDCGQRLIDCDKRAYRCETCAQQRVDAWPAQEAERLRREDALDREYRPSG